MTRREDVITFSSCYMMMGGGVFPLNCRMAIFYTSRNVTRGKLIVIPVMQLIKKNAVVFVSDFVN